MPGNCLNNAASALVVCALLSSLPSSKRSISACVAGLWMDPVKEGYHIIGKMPSSHHSSTL